MRDKEGERWKTDYRRNEGETGKAKDTAPRGGSTDKVDSHE